MSLPWRQLRSAERERFRSVSSTPPSCHAPVCSLLLILSSLLFLIIPSIFHLHIKDVRLKLAGVRYPSLPFQGDPWSLRCTYACGILPHYGAYWQSSRCLRMSGLPLGLKMPALSPLFIGYLSISNDLLFYETFLFVSVRNRCPLYKPLL